MVYDGYATENVKVGFEQDRPPAPDRDCRGCGERHWYWPGDYYWGKKTWQCGKCNPPPAGQEVEYSDEIGDKN